ncbi:MAG: hypothetical protein ABIO70_11670 [Pseudomonadota bacterium]
MMMAITPDTAMRTFHVPMPEALHDALKAEASAMRRPAAELVREALSTWIEAQRRQRLAQEIQAYAEAEAGGYGDLDSELEAAGIEHLMAADEP